MSAEALHLPTDEIGWRSIHDPYCYLMPLDAVIKATQELLDGQSPLARWRATIFDDLEDVSNADTPIRSSA